MSFILDALRKSEAERQREAVPTVARTPLAPVRRQVPLWSWALIGALSLIVITLGVAWWQSIGFGPGEDPTLADTVPAGFAAPETALAGNAARTVNTSPASGPGASSPTNSAPNATLDLASGQSSRQSSPMDRGSLSGRSASLPETLDSAPTAETVRSEADQAAPLHPIGELAFIDPNQPTFRLDLLAYHSDPDRAYAIVNGRRYRTGERTASGPSVTDIRRDGVVLTHRGERFLLRPR
jgi:general secretion pathway protein B